MEEKTLQAWIKEITEQIPEPPKAFQEDVLKDPAATLKDRGFNLHDSYREKLMGLSEEQREEIAKLFNQIANSKPGELREIYATYAEMCEHFYQWEGALEPGIRGWLFP